MFVNMRTWFKYNIVFLYVYLSKNIFRLEIGLYKFVNRFISYDIKLLFVTYWWYKQSICSKNL